MKRLYFFLLFITLLSAGCAKAIPPTSDPQSEKVDSSQLPVAKKNISINNTTLEVELADTAELQAQGLSGRSQLADDQGMLFDFRHSANTTPSFWMKDMQFALDIIWIKGNAVLAITKNVPAPDKNTPLSQLSTYSPPTEIEYVLEVNAGWSEAHQLRPGDAVTF